MSKGQVTKTKPIYGIRSLYIPTVKLTSVLLLCRAPHKNVTG